MNVIEPLALGVGYCICPGLEDQSHLGRQGVLATGPAHQLTNDGRRLALESQHPFSSAGAAGCVDGAPVLRDASPGFTQPR